MSARPGDKSVSECRRAEVLGYLLKTADYDGMGNYTPDPTLTERGLSALWTGADAIQPADSALSTYRAGRGLYGAGQAMRAGQGITSGVQALAKPFSPVSAAVRAPGIVGGLKYGAGKAVPVIGGLVSAYGTYGAVRNQANNAQDYRNAGQHYWGGEESIGDTMDTIGNAAPLIGGAIGSAIPIPGVGTAAGMGIGYAVQGGLWGAKKVMNGVTGFDSQKNALARNAVSGQGYSNAADFVAHGNELANSPAEMARQMTSTSWFGKKRDFAQENGDAYMKQQAKAQAKSQTNKDQVA